MKIGNSDLVDAMSTGVSTLCLCWLFTRSDGVRFGASDHDRELVIDGVICRPQSGLSQSDFRTGADLAPGQAAASGVLSDAFLTDQDLDAGLWDGARVDVYRVNWRASEQRAHVWSGRLGEVARSGATFRVELVSQKADLERRIGRVYSRDCDAEIGDARCGVDLSASAYRAEGRIEFVVSGRKLRTSSVSGFASGFFSGGQLHLPTGEHARIQSHEGDSLVLANDTPVAVGDTVIATAGCNKRFETCGARFSNTENFRGFPHLPGMDAIVSGPSGGGEDNGGKR